MLGGRAGVQGLQPLGLVIVTLFHPGMQAKCSTINSMVKAKFPMLAEFHWVLRCAPL